MLDMGYLGILTLFYLSPNYVVIHFPQGAIMWKRLRCLFTFDHHNLFVIFCFVFAFRDKVLLCSSQETGTLCVNKRPQTYRYLFASAL